MGRQYFNAQIADPLISAITITPALANTALFNTTQAPLYFPIGTGVNAPSAGQAFRFVLGGILTTPTVGTMIITPYMGISTSGTVLGASAAQTYTAGQTNIPWRIEGELVFRSISATSTSSTCWLTGTFSSVGAIGTAGSAWVSTFGSTAAVSVDTTGAATISGALNWGFTFSVTGSSITTEYTSFQSLN